MIFTSILRLEQPQYIAWENVQPSSFFFVSSTMQRCKWLCSCKVDLTGYYQSRCSFFDLQIQTGNRESFHTPAIPSKFPLPLDTKTPCRSKVTHTLCSWIIKPTIGEICGNTTLSGLPWPPLKGSAVNLILQLKASSIHRPPRPPPQRCRSHR